jgi:hypothetical protein
LDLKRVTFTNLIVILYAFTVRTNMLFDRRGKFSKGKDDIVNSGLNLNCRYMSTNRKRVKTTL